MNSNFKHQSIQKHFGVIIENDKVITNITDSTENISKGSIFFARQGMSSHGSDYIKLALNRGAILIRRNLECESEFKTDLDQIGLLNSTQIGFEMISVEPTVNNFRGSYCDNIPFGYGLSVSPIQLINAYGKIITGRENFNATFEKKEKQNENKFYLS